MRRDWAPAFAGEACCQVALNPGRRHPANLQDVAPQKRLRPALRCGERAGGDSL